MDFLEGVFLGPLWCDTDFEDREHNGLRLFFDLAFWAGFLAVVYFINYRVMRFPFLESLPYGLIFLVLFIVSPFLCAIYYRMPVAARLPIILLQMIKHLAYLFAIYRRFLPRLRFNRDAFVAGVMNFFNQTIGRFIEYYTERYEATGMLISTAVLALVGVLALALLIALITYLPRFLFWIMRQVQNIWDDLMTMLFKLIRRQRWSRGFPASGSKAAPGAVYGGGALASRSPSDATMQVHDVMHRDPSREAPRETAQRPTSPRQFKKNGGPPPGREAGLEGRSQSRPNTER